MAKKKLQARRRQRIQFKLSWLKPMLAVLTVSGSAIGLTLMLDWMNNPRHWPVNRVHIEGEFRHLQQTDIQEKVVPIAADGFFAMNVAEIQAHLQALAWVDQVSVRRVWPDRLEILVREQQAVAHWGERGFMNARAQVFEPQPYPELETLPYLKGPQGYEKRVLVMYRELADLLVPLKLKITYLNLSPRRAWDVQLSNGLTLAVGRNQPVARVARFVRVYPAILASGDGRVSAVDLRYSNGFAVHWQTTNQTAKSAG